MVHPHPTKLLLFFNSVFGSFCLGGWGTAHVDLNSKNQASARIASYTSCDHCILHASAHDQDTARPCRTKHASDSSARRVASTRLNFTATSCSLSCRIDVLAALFSATAPA